MSDLPTPPPGCEIVHDGETDAPGKRYGDLVHVRLGSGGKWVEVHPPPGDIEFYRYSVYARKKEAAA